MYSYFKRAKYYLSTKFLRNKRGSGIIALSVGALGVVFGDIGTSPLYAINEIFFGKSQSTLSNPEIFGGISLVFWAVTLVVAFKYIFFVMNADNDGEGGVFALYSNIEKVKKGKYWLLSLLLFGAGLLYGDGIITPAISVVSAVEGLKILTPSLENLIVPISIVILTILFSIQSKGTGNVGKVFGPIMVVWFLTLGALGLKQVLLNHEILNAINPYWAYNFIVSHELSKVFFVLGSVMLVITGGEAMFADMGHFGKKPIQIAWYFLAYPALILNYLGQGSFLLSGGEVLNGNIFYSMVPNLILPIIVILATFASVIASQAMISGAFSITMQAISLRLLPYLPIKHTDAHHAGQIYIPHVNWALYIGAVTLILVFKSGTNLAGAYGFAVAGDMFITTLCVILISISIWNWKKVFAFGLFIPFLLLDLIFVFANSLKIFEGGFIPLTIGLFIYGVIKIWKWGRYHKARAYESIHTMTIKDLIKLQENSKNDLKKTMVMLTSKAISSVSEHTPTQLQRYWDRNGILPEHLVFLNIILLKKPKAKKRILVNNFLSEKGNGTITNITLQFGFMEDPNIEPLVKFLIKHKDVPSNHKPESWIFKAMHSNVLIQKHANLKTKLKFFIYSFLHRNSSRPDEYFGLGQNHTLVVDIIPVQLK